VSSGRRRTQRTGDGRKRGWPRRHRRGAGVRWRGRRVAPPGRSPPGLRHRQQYGRGRWPPRPVGTDGARSGGSLSSCRCRCNRRAGGHRRLSSRCPGWAGAEWCHDTVRLLTLCVVAGVQGRAPRPRGHHPARMWPGRDSPTAQPCADTCAQWDATHRGPWQCGVRCPQPAGDE
jgi:hypothetical protein